MATQDNVLPIKALAPGLSASFSPNLHRWLKSRGTGRREGLVRDVVYRVKPDTRMAREVGAGTLIIGHPYNAYEGDTDVSGVRMIEVLCHGAQAERLCLTGALAALEPISDFWTKYLQVGRCAFDPQHLEHFVDTERYTGSERGKVCIWCGADCSHLD